jgi:hypothetical protein
MLPNEKKSYLALNLGLQFKYYTACLLTLSNCVRQFIHYKNFDEGSDSFSPKGYRKTVKVAWKGMVRRMIIRQVQLQFQLVGR